MATLPIDQMRKLQDTATDAAGAALMIERYARSGDIESARNWIAVVRREMATAEEILAKHDRPVSQNERMRALAAELRNWHGEHGATL